MPQFTLSSIGLTHTPLHVISPAGHAHADDWHVVPFVQTLLHVPQSSEFIVVSMQTSPHSLKPGAQPHWPLPQSRPGEHAFEHMPQYSGFDCRSTHAPLQSVKPSGQLAAHTLFAHAGVPPEHVVAHAPQ